MVTGVTATSVTVHWNPLPQQYHNGRLLGYSVFFRKTASYLFPVTRSVVVHNFTSVTLHNLEPGQRYEIYLSAFTSKGDGPRSDGYFVITGTNCNQASLRSCFTWQLQFFCIWKLGDQVGLTWLYIRNLSCPQQSCLTIYSWRGWGRGWWKVVSLCSVDWGEPRLSATVLLGRFSLAEIGD